VLIRAHGEPPETYKTAIENNIELIDASCPVVLKLQNRIRNGVENLGAKKEYVEFLGELVKSLKNKYEAKKITYIGHSAGCMMGATLSGVRTSLLDNVVCAGGIYDIKKEKPTAKNLISIVDVLDKVDIKTKFVLIYGTADDISKPKTTIDFYNLAKSKGFNVKLVEVKDAPHLDLDMTSESIEAIVELVEE
jgi:predicted esterase